MVNRSRYIQAVVLIAFLIALFSNASAQPQSVFGKWYVIVLIKQPISDTHVPYEWAETLVLNSDSTICFSLRGSNNCGKWQYNSQTQRFTGSADGVQFVIRIVDSSLVADYLIKDYSITDSVSGSLSMSPRWKVVREENFNWSIKRGKLRLSVDYSKSVGSNAHLNFGFIQFHNGMFISLDLASMSVLQIEKRTLLSSNATFVIPLACLRAIDPGYRILPIYSVIIALPVFLHGLTNFDIYVPMYDKYIRAGIGQSTDYFFFVNPSRILPETHVGLMFSMEPLDIPLQITAQLCQPWFKGYRDNHNMYFKTTIGWML